MVGPVFSSPGFPRIPRSEITTPQVSCQQMQQGVDKFVRALKSLKEDPSLAKNPHFLRQIHENLSVLRGQIESVLKVKE